MTKLIYRTKSMVGQHKSKGNENGSGQGFY